MSAPPQSDREDGIAFLLHTRNRPEFLLRTLDYLDQLNANSSRRVIVLDASDADKWAIIDEAVGRRHFVSQIECRHADPSTPLRVRLAQAFDGLATPYVAFAADDDFYLPDWFAEAIAEFERDGDIGTVHGHVIFFSLPAYEPYGPLQHYFVHPRELPPVSWLEADSAAERIASVTDGSHEPSVPGWYALQRTDHLRTILDHAVRIDLPDAYLEYWLVFYQAVLGKTRLLDRIILARQVNPNGAHRTPRLETARPWLERMRTEFLDLLAFTDSINAEAAEKVVDRYLRGVANDFRRPAAERFPFGHGLLRAAWRRLTGKPPLPANSRATTYPDRRLPPLPPVGPDHPAIKLISRWTAPNGDCRG